MPHDTDPERTPAGFVRDPDDRVRDPAARLRDHAVIERLAEDLVPALTAKLGASGLGELEIREGGWRVRLRMPAEAHATARRTSAPARPGVPGGSSRPAQSGNVAPAGPVAVALSQAPGASDGAAPDRGGSRGVSRRAPAAHDHAGHRAVAVSPAVGFYRPQTSLTPGAKVRAGDRLGVVDVLGIPYDIVAPIDGHLGAALVEPGDPVEYGQEIVMVERLDRTAPDAAAAPAAPDAAAAPAAAPSATAPRSAAAPVAAPVEGAPDVPAAPSIATPGGATR